MAARPGAVLAAATDADDPGQRHAGHLAELAAAAGVLSERTTIPTAPSFPFERTVAERKDWVLADASFHTDGMPVMELQATQDGHPDLIDDQAAWKHVVAHARQGSDLHRAALAAVDNVERTLFEATCGAW